MERVEGIEPSHQPWQGRRLPLHHTRFKMVDRKRIELFPKACKAPVLPLSLTAHKLVGVERIELPQEASKTSALPLCNTPVNNGGKGGNSTLGGCYPSAV